MPDLPDASYQGRENQKKPEKSVKKVTTGEVKTKKKSEFKKFAGFFVPDDVTNVKSYILTDVIIPGIKRGVADVVSIILFGEVGQIGSRAKGNTAYSRMYRGDPRDRERRDYTRPKAGYDFDDIIFETRGDAELVLEQLEEIINVYGVASVEDLYDLAGITAPSHTAQNYGWDNIRNAKPVRIKDSCYILQLPKAMPIT